MKNITVDWIAGDKNEWFHLLGLNLDSIVPQDAFGVYIMWQYRSFYNDMIFEKQCKETLLTGYLSIAGMRKSPNMPSSPTNYM